MKKCDYCKKTITSPLRVRFCSDDCCYKMKISNLPSIKNPKVKQRKVYSSTHFDWRDFDYRAII